MRDRLYLLRAPFEDAGQVWYCRDCATLEGALLANPAWLESLDIRRIAFPRPRQELVDLVGETRQDLPMLVMDPNGAPPSAARGGAYAVLQDPRAIAEALVARHGGAGAHP